MRFRRYINNIKSISVFSASLTMMACGGGGSNSSVNNPTAQQTVPIQIAASNWDSADLLSRNVTVIDTQFNEESLDWVINIGDDTISQNDHIQVYLDIDNDPATGFQFDNEAWADKSGADYLIEDEVLFKSTSNNSSWSWKEVATVATIKQTNSVQITAPITLFEGICNTYNIGVVGRSETWNIEAFAPQSNSLLTQQIAYCDDRVQNQRPVITLSDNTPLVVNQFSEIVVPTATALDLEDGDISANITVSDTAITDEVGVYSIIYSVRDSNDLAALPVELTVIVKYPNSESGISVDGNSSDWAAIPNLALNATTVMKVTDDADHVYILVEGEDLGVNTQIFIDSDNSLNTGYLLSGDTADYMIENNSFSNHLGIASYAWTWDYNFAVIPMVRLNNTIELAIPKSKLANLTNTPKFGFTSRDQSWNINYVLSQTLNEYTLLFPIDNTDQLDAVDDYYEITNDFPVHFSVTDNDTHPSNELFMLVAVTQPEAGLVTFDELTESLTFDPQGNIGTFTFTYTIQEDETGIKDTATVTVEVTEGTGNRRPIAVEDSAVTSPTTPVTIDVLANDSDPDGDTLTIVPVPGGYAGGADIKIVDSKLVYTPAPSVGSILFYYTISDGRGGTASAPVRVTVTTTPNQSPDAVDDEASVHITIPNRGKRIHVLDNDTDSDGDSLTIISFSTPQNGRTEGAPENTIAYFPNAGFEGTDSFTYTISDGNGGTDTAKVTVIVTQSLNNPPDAVEDAPTTGMNTPIDIKVLANDTDPDGDSLTIVSFTQPPLGAVTQVDAETLRFDPQGNIGSIAFSYTITDGRGGTDSTVVTIASVDPDDSEHASFPVITGENITITEGESILIDVLANDTDADGDVLILDMVDQGGHGTTVKQDGKVLYTPVPGYIGTDEFYYGVHDGYGHNGSGKVTVTIIAPPVPQ